MPLGLGATIGLISGGMVAADEFIFDNAIKDKVEESFDKWKMNKAKNKIAAAEELQKTLITDRKNLDNPYAGVKDLSGMLKNEYQHLSVATQAAEMQAEEADIALANALDTLRSTGSGAGGATALAQAALRSKKSISANIEQQEAANEKLRAKGQADLQKTQLAEAQRMQTAGVAAKQFELDENMMELDRQQQIIDNERQRRMNNVSSAIGAFTSTADLVVAGIGATT